MLFGYPASTTARPPPESLIVPLGFFAAVRLTAASAPGNGYVATVR